MLIRQILSAIDILNFYLDLRYDIRKNTNTKKDRKWRINGNSNYETKRSSGNRRCWGNYFKDIRRKSTVAFSSCRENSREWPANAGYVQAEQNCMNWLHSNMTQPWSWRKICKYILCFGYCRTDMQHSLPIIDRRWIWQPRKNFGQSRPCGLAFIQIFV